MTSAVAAHPTQPARKTQAAAGFSAAVATRPNNSFDFYETLRDVTKHRFTFQRTFVRLPNGVAHHRPRSKHEPALGSIMMGKMACVCLAFVCAAQAATAQDLRPAQRHATLRTAINHETFDVSMARLAAKAAFQPAAQPTQQELLGVIVLMSLRQQQRPST
jgi:hypothetical protein